MLNLDTHIFIHALNGNLTKREETLLSQNEWGISSIVLWEIAKLSQLKRIAIDLNDPDFISSVESIKVWEINLSICKIMQNLDFKSDPADEIIAATSILYSIPLVTRDEKILESKIVPFAI